jgi:3-methylcrotonyl-CoA carboxylase alpha subunit
MFRTVLIANRGEIACRIMRTAKRMGVRSIAVYSDADRKALHVREADAAVRLGPAPARESYLAVDRVMKAALAAGAEAVHPGYGFLSENPELAEACARAKVVFVGPPAAAIRAMGDKSEAKALMVRAGVPVVPGYHGAAQEHRRLKAEAGKIGYPVLIKAAAGGGGKGMKTAAGPRDFDEAVASARREAKAAFGDDRVLLEKYLVRPRHVEVQVFADSRGNTVSLFERDCSLQRRHQKIIEEAPAPGLATSKREEMAQAAVSAAKAVGYLGAGTIEFLLDEDGAFYFMEMNTRLQVEHPVTEMITGLDLVEWQLRVAAGERLPRLGPELAIAGHAVEARLYAEDPDRGFLPQTGRIGRLRFPATGPTVRVDSGITEGDTISPYYDPLIAKVIAWGEDRGAAVRRVEGALAQIQIAGIRTNVPFLSRLVRHEAFQSGDVDTGFLTRHEGDLFEISRKPDERRLAIAGFAVLAHQARFQESETDPFSPWAGRDGWRLNTRHLATVEFEEAEPVRFDYLPGAGSEFRFSTAGMTIAGSLDGDGLLSGALDGDPFAVGSHLADSELTLFVDGDTQRFRLKDRIAEARRTPSASGSIAAPMPGRVLAIHVRERDQVKANAALLVLEAMKMEHVIRAPLKGVVTAIAVSEGAQVNEGDALMVVAGEP